MNEISVTVCGNVATDPKHQITKNGKALTTFRLACTPRRYDAEVDGYLDGETTWLGVKCWNTLALNTAQSVTKGQPVVVSGILRVREWESDDKNGIEVELKATTVGHDLRMGRASFARVGRPGSDRHNNDRAVPTSHDEVAGTDESLPQEPAA